MSYTPKTIVETTLGATSTSWQIATGLSLDTLREVKLQLRLLLAPFSGNDIHLGLRGVFNNVNYAGWLDQGGTFNSFPSELKLANNLSSAYRRFNIDITISKQPGFQTSYRGLGEPLRDVAGSLIGSIAWGVDAATADVAELGVNVSGANSLLAGSVARLLPVL